MLVGHQSYRLCRVQNNQCTVDWLLHSSSSLHCERREHCVEPAALTNILVRTRLPTVEYPSDHLPIAAVYSVRAQPVRRTLPSPNSSASTSPVAPSKKQQKRAAKAAAAEQRRAERQAAMAAQAAAAAGAAVLPSVTTADESRSC